MIIKCHIWICYHLLAACAILFWLRRLSGGHMFHLNFFSSILAGFLTDKPSRRSQNWTYFIAFKKISKLKLFDRIYKDSMWLIHYVGKGLFDLHTHVFPFEVKSGYKWFVFIVPVQYVCVFNHNLLQRSTNKGTVIKCVELILQWFFSLGTGTFWLYINPFPLWLCR